MQTNVQDFNTSEINKTNSISKRNKSRPEGVNLCNTLLMLSMFIHVQRRNEFAGRVTQERTEVDAIQTKSATGARVTTTLAASKPKLKPTKVCLLSP